MPLLAAILLAAAPPGDAPPSPPTSETDSIVVTGTPQTREEARERALEFVRRTGVAEADPIARWVTPVCPRVSGVDAKVAAIVAERVRIVAAEAGARVAKTGCEPNIAIVFTRDGVGFAQAAMRKAPARFQQMPPSTRERLLESDDAIRWFHTTRMRSRHGSAISSAPMPGVGSGEGAVPTIGGPSLSQYNTSLVSTQAVRALSTATVIIDVERASGYPLEAIASFAAMVALVEMDDDPPPPGGSILSLFDGEADRQELSDQDMAFLQAVYRLPPDREARQHRRQLVGAMTREAIGDK